MPSETEQPTIKVTLEELETLISNLILEVDYDHWKELYYDHDGWQSEEDENWKEGDWFRHEAKRIFESYSE